MEGIQWDGLSDHLHRQTHKKNMADLQDIIGDTTTVIQRMTRYEHWQHKDTFHTSHMFMLVFTPTEQQNPMVMTLTITPKKGVNVKLMEIAPPLIPAHLNWVEAQLEKASDLLYKQK